MHNIDWDWWQTPNYEHGNNKAYNLTSEIDIDYWVDRYGDDFDDSDNYLGRCGRCNNPADYVDNEYILDYDTNNETEIMCNECIEGIDASPEHICYKCNQPLTEDGRILPSTILPPEHRTGDDIILCRTCFDKCLKTHHIIDIQQ